MKDEFFVLPDKKTLDNPFRFCYNIKSSQCVCGVSLPRKGAKVQKEVHLNGKV